ncbi:MAG: glutathione S-transferase family protein [Gammaproteobacteria bacterium]|nr:glutathione S-transferase family protein [Gammaproteobacteria bacterium]
MTMQLVSFKLCPFVQRSVITLIEKGVDYDITYIDLAEPPDWFLAISPFGKVPVLRVDDTVLFESAVINEYLDEIHPPSLHPADPLRKAQSRAWIEFGSALIVDQYQMMTAADDDAFDTHHHAVVKKLAQLETLLGDGPFFNGPAFSLVDAALAPLFLRFEVLNGWHALDVYDGLEKVPAWHRALLARPSTRASVVPDFDGLLRDYIRAHGTYGAQLFG